MALTPNLLAALRWPIAAAVDLALPARCPGCGAVTREDGRFCLACWQSLDFLARPTCAQCAETLDVLAAAGSRCGRCLADPPRFDRVHAAVAYGDVARAVVLKMKHGGRPMLAGVVARHMARLLADSPGEALLVPVPLHRWRLWRRGYNQSALVARALGRLTGREVDVELLVRGKATPMLGGLGRRARARAVQGAFAVRPGTRLRGRPVLLVDDVLTSGATADACAATLKCAGAARVELVCWARVASDERGDAPAR